MRGRLVAAAKSSVVHSAALLVALLAACACSDAKCPADTVEINQRCVVQMQNASSVSGAGAGSVGQAAADGGSATTQTASALPGQAASDASGAPSMGGKRTTLADGERCVTPDECASGFCKNVRNGTGICCGATIDCCKTADDCPGRYASPPKCDDASSCRGSKTVAVCMSAVCGSSMVAAPEACDGMKGPSCGAYQDVVCMAAQSTACRTSCSSNAECDANAICSNRQCQSKKPNGGTCASASECESGNCTNAACCSTGGECCANADDCTMGLDARCESRPTCQGTIREAVCENSVCRYGNRKEDDRACSGKGSDCDDFAPVICSGTPVQTQACKTACDADADCDPGLRCMPISGTRLCLSTSGTSPAARSDGQGNRNTP